MISKLLTPDTIQLNVKVSDWRDAVSRAGALLVKNGLVAKEYVDAMINTVEELGPYIVLTKGFAMPHARPTEGVKQMCMSLITLAEPVSFGHPEHDPVDLVLALGAVDNNSHISVISELSTLLSNSSLITELRRAKTIDQVLGLLKQVERSSKGSRNRTEDNEPS